MFHLTLGYMFPPLHSPLHGDYVPERRASGSSGDGSLTVEATGIQPEQTTAPFRLMSQKKSDLVASIKNDYYKLIEIAPRC